MGFKSDIEIAQETAMAPITEIAEKLGIADKYLEQYGKYKAKIDYNLLKESDAKNGKLILVTAINPTPAGEGKTTTSVGLADGLDRTCGWSQKNRKRCYGCSSRAFPGTGFRRKRRSGRRRICAGSSDGRYQSAFHR